MLSVNSNISKINFKQQNDSEKPNPSYYSADQFLKDTQALEEKRLKGGISSKYFGSMTAIYGGSGFILLGELALLFAKRNKKVSVSFKNKIPRLLLGVFAGGIAIGALIQSWQNKIIDKNSSKPKEMLEKYGSDTSAKLAEYNLRSNVIGAQYNAINGTIEINKNYINDPIGKNLIKKYMKHELQHARQFEMIACLDNGLAKLNFANLHKISEYVKKHPLAQSQFRDIINNVNNDKEGLYDDVKISLSGAEVNFKDYVKAIEVFMNNENAQPDDIPMIIDVEHYKKAIAKRGPLTEEEKIKAEEYYQAALKYPTTTAWEIINPFSGYWTNILEKEARKVSRQK